MPKIISFRRNLGLGPLLFRSAYLCRFTAKYNTGQIFWEDQKSFFFNLTLLWLFEVISKKVGDFFQIFWPSQNIWTLIHRFYDYWAIILLTFRNVIRKIAEFPKPCKKSKVFIKTTQSRFLNKEEYAKFRYSEKAKKFENISHHY